MKANSPPVTIRDLELTVYVQNCLKAERIHTVAELCDYTERKLLRVPNIGPVSVRQIKHMLALHGLTLKDGSLPTEKEATFTLIFCGDKPKQNKPSLNGNKPTLKWSYKSGEGFIDNLENFRKVDWTTRADALIDWIWALEKEYTATLEGNHESK